MLPWQMDNVVFRGEGARLQLQLVDFGVTAACDSFTRFSDYIGTEHAMAPEVAAFGIAGSATPYLGFPTDLWGLGVIMCARPPPSAPIQTRRPNPTPTPALSNARSRSNLAHRCAQV